MKTTVAALTKRFNEARARRPGSGVEDSDSGSLACGASMRPGREGPGVGVIIAIRVARSISLQ